MKESVGRYVTKTIREMLEDKDQVTLSELYDVVLEHPNSEEFSVGTMKHRVRSALYSMTKSGKIKRSGTATYSTV